MFDQLELPRRKKRLKLSRELQIPHLSDPFYSTPQGTSGKFCVNDGTVDLEKCVLTTFGQSASSMVSPSPNASNWPIVKFRTRNTLSIFLKSDSL